MTQSCIQQSDQTNDHFAAHNKLKISIIIATYNYEAALDIILNNLCLQIHNSQMLQKYTIEIVIADDGSTNATKNIITKYQNQYDFIVHVWQEDLGFLRTKILNKAVNQATGDYLIFLDGDCVPFSDYLSEHINLMERGYLVAGNRVLLSQKFSKAIFADPQIIHNIIKWRLFHWIYAAFKRQVNKILPPRMNIPQSAKWRYRRINDWKYPKGCNFAVHKSSFMQVNGFDESFSGWGYEDSDLFVRLIHTGIKIKNGRFAIPVLHLWHKQSTRDSSNSNLTRLMKRVSNINDTKAIKGINQII